MFSRTFLTGPLSVVALGAALSTPAFAASREVDVEFGWQGTSDEAFALFSPADAFGTVGIRLGYAVHPRLALILGWQHGTTGVSVESEYYDYEEDEEGSTSADNGSIEPGGFRTAFYGDQLTLGAKFDVAVKPWFSPYVTVQGSGMRAVARIDDDADDDENLTQIERVGLTGGVIGAAGAEFPIRLNSKVALAPYAELGYGWYAPLAFEDLGTVQFSGFAGRAGVGVRF